MEIEENEKENLMLKEILKYLNRKMNPTSAGYLQKSLENLIVMKSKEVV